MNRFRKLGFITYNGHIEVHKSLLNLVLHEQQHINNYPHWPVNCAGPAQFPCEQSRTAFASRLTYDQQIGLGIICAGA